MKRLIILTIFASLLVVTNCMAQSGKVTTVAIQDSSKAPYYVYQKVCGTGSPYAEIAKHKHHEAAVFHSGEDYKLTYYQLEKDSIRYHAAIYGSDDIMDKAEYRWDKDTVFVRLYNSITNKEVKFGAFSHNGANSMFMVN